MVLSVFAITHRTATLAAREPFQLPRRQLGGAVLAFRRSAGVDEAAVVATCNRVEFYRVHETKGDIAAEVADFYRARGVPDADRVRNLGEVHVGAGAARHLFRVTSGMDSLVIGEEQVRGQVKDAYSAACGVGGPGPVLHKLFHHAFRVSRRVASETDLGSGVRSVPGAAVQRLMENLPAGARALVVGANETTEVVLGHLQRRGIPAILVNRTRHTAEKLASVYGARVADWDEIASCLAGVELAFSATGASSQVISREMIAERGGRPLRIADLAVPRDVDPAAADLPGVELLDLQELAWHLERAERRRSDDLPRAQELIERQVDGFLHWLHARTFAGGIEAVRRELHAAADEELERFRGSFHRSEVKALDAFAHALIKRFLKFATDHFEPEGSAAARDGIRRDPAALEGPDSPGRPLDPETGKPVGCRELRRRGAQRNGET